MQGLATPGRGLIQNRETGRPGNRYTGAAIHPAIWFSGLVVYKSVVDVELQSGMIDFKSGFKTDSRPLFYSAGKAAFSCAAT